MKRLVLIFGLSALVSMSIIAQTIKVVSYPQFVSNSLLVFSKYVNWPLNHKNGDFIITIIGNPDVYKELSNNIHTMKVGSQNIIVRYYNKVNDIQDFSHIIFLSENNSSTIKKVTDKVGSENTLIVTSSEGLLTYGAGINFIPVDGLMKFEISKGNISKRNLEIHSWLEKMAAKQG